MGRSVREDLSPGEWAVLGAVAEGRTHGFALAQLLAPGGALGRVWTLTRGRIYQILKKLVQVGLVAELSTERGDRGPLRTIVAVTPAGQQALDGWLEQPVDHVRDVRSMLLLKLALLARSHRDWQPLIELQRRRITAQMHGLDENRAKAVGFEQVLLEWRATSSRATIDFLDAISTVVVEN